MVLSSEYLVLVLVKLEVQRKAAMALWHSCG